MKKRLLIIAALVLVLVPTAAFALPRVYRDVQQGRQLAEVRKATKKYQDVNVAIADGYIPTDHCVDGPDGGMGYHYFHPELGSDLVNDPLQPELLIYVPDDHGIKLGAVEYFQANVGQERPTIFGQPFDGPMDGHEPGMPEHYDLHVWLFERNPDGVFAPWNTRVSCSH